MKLCLTYPAQQQLLLSEMGKSHGKGIAPAQRQFPATAGLCLLGSGCMARGICCIQAGAVSQLWHCWHTWCLVLLSTGVSIHHAWKISSLGIHYCEGGMAQGLTLLAAHLPWSCPFHPGSCCVVCRHKGCNRCYLRAPGDAISTAADFMLLWDLCRVLAVFFP